MATLYLGYRVALYIKYTINFPVCRWIFQYSKNHNFLAFISFLSLFSFHCLITLIIIFQFFQAEKKKSSSLRDLLCHSTPVNLDCTLIRSTMGGEEVNYENYFIGFRHFIIHCFVDYFDNRPFWSFHHCVGQLLCNCRSNMCDCRVPKRFLSILTRWTSVHWSSSWKEFIVYRTTD